MLNTTHHVLKRIAVPNEGMLTEVKKEVDIMVRACNLGCPSFAIVLDRTIHFS